MISKLLLQTRTMSSQQCFDKLWLCEGERWELRNRAKPKNLMSSTVSFPRIWCIMNDNRSFLMIFITKIGLPLEMAKKKLKYIARSRKLSICVDFKVKVFVFNDSKSWQAKEKLKLAFLGKMLNFRVHWKVLQIWQQWEIVLQKPRRIF
jgi:hypothetical protein